MQPQRANLAVSKLDKEKQKRFLNYAKKAIATTKQDIASWKRAQTMAQSDEPKNWMLQLLFDEILNDALLTSQINNREQQSFSMNFSLKKPNGETDEEQTDLLKKHPIYRQMNKARLDAIYQGYSLLELDYVMDLNGKRVLNADLIPRTNVVPQTGLFYPDYVEDKPVKYREMPEFGLWIIEYNSGSLGLVNKAVSHVLFKRFAQSCWAELCEIYGIPPRYMKTNTQDSVMLARAEQMMSDMGAAAWFIIDDSETFEFADGVSTKGEVYESLIQLCNNEISMLVSGAVIGQDTKNGNRSKEESSQETLWYLVQDDMALLEDTWNNVNIPALVKHGILKGELTFEFDEAEDLEQLWKMTSEALQHYDIDPEWIKDKFNIDVVAKKAKDEKDTSEKLQMMFDFFQAAPAGTTGATMKQLAQTCCSGTHIQLALPKRDFDTKAYLKRIFDGGGKLTFDTGLFEYTAQILLSGFKKGWDKPAAAKLKNIGMTYNLEDPTVLTAYEANLFRFSAGKTLAEVRKLNDAFKKSTSFNDFYIRAKQITDVHNKTYLQTEYNAAMAVGSSTANYYSLMSATKVYPFWEYKTVDDDKVRASHRKLHGIILPFDDPLWKIIFPPNGWNCRCRVEGRMKHQVDGIDFDAMREKVQEYMASAEYLTSTKQGWDMNRADLGVAFTSNQQYITSFSDEPGIKIQDLGATDYNLKPYSEALDRASKSTPVYNDSSEDFIKRLEVTEAGKRVIRDYRNRPIEVTREFLEEAKTNPKEIAAALETFKAPDETWINNQEGTELEDLISIKYYKDKTFVGITKIVNGKASKVIRWVSATADTIDQFRKGLLIYSKAK